MSSIQIVHVTDAIYIGATYFCLPGYSDAKSFIFFAMPCSFPFIPLFYQVSPTAASTSLGVDAFIAVLCVCLPIFGLQQRGDLKIGRCMFSISYYLQRLLSSFIGRRFHIQSKLQYWSLPIPCCRQWRSYICKSDQCIVLI